MEKLQPAAWRVYRLSEVERPGSDEDDRTLVALARAIMKGNVARLSSGLYLGWGWATLARNRQRFRV